MISNIAMHLMILDVPEIVKRNHGNRFISHINLKLYFKYIFKMFFSKTAVYKFYNTGIIVIVQHLLH